MQPLLSARRLIFLDEIDVTTNMVRRHGRSPRGTRGRGYAPAGHWKVTTFLAGLDHDGIVAPFVVDQPMNRAIFTQYVRQYLAPGGQSPVTLDGQSRAQITFLREVLAGVLWLTPARRATSRSEKLQPRFSATSAAAASINARRRSP